MIERIGKTEVTKMFVEAAKQIRDQHVHLSELDCVSGDGDHGTAMLHAVDQLEAASRAESEQSLKMLFKNAGWKVLSVDGGASSALLGTFFGGMGEAEIGDEIDCNGLACAFEAGLRAVSKQTKAQPGDKTLMDALIPAVCAVRSGALSGKTIPAALKEAADAAHSGAESTKYLIAKYGRARFSGEKARGNQDAGATSIALLFRGFSEAFADERKD
jgi:dihydroxyacetone kinase-like protein